MHVAVTGATGFLGRYIVRHLARRDHHLRCWHRPTSDRSGFELIDGRIDWMIGELGHVGATQRLVSGCDAVVHSALYRQGDTGFRGSEGDLITFAYKNVIGTLHLIEAAIKAKVQRFIFISTCAVHEIILNDRPLDEAHPLWPTSHYGAHKAAIEKFVHSYGFGQGFPICALRPTGIYGLAHPPSQSRWWDIVAKVKAGEDVEVTGGGKEVHAADVAKAVELLLTTKEEISGQSYNCYNGYVSQYDVASVARTLSRSPSQIIGQQKRPQHEIKTDKLRALGMTYGDATLLHTTIQEMLDAMD
jgi:nucleoside-diphosphate-sugar epimerase